MGFAPTHTPLLQVSVWLHLSPSLQPEPSFLLGLEQVPVAESQVPASWHWSLAAQTTGLAPLHTPPWQVSVWVHLSASLQAAPFVLVGFEQLPDDASQVPAE